MPVQTQTFSMWLGEFAGAFHRGEFQDRPLGTAFVDALTRVRPFVAGGFIYAKCDPFGLTEIPQAALDFVERNW